MSYFDCLLLCEACYYNAVQGLHIAGTHASDGKIYIHDILFGTVLIMYDKM